MRPGVRIGIDVGKARIGVARSDAHGLLATPLETVPRDRTSPADSRGTDVQRIAALAAELEAREAVVGLPLNLRGDRTASTEDAEKFAGLLARELHDSGVSVRLVDERLSTVSAQQQLHRTGKNTKQSRQIIDQAAAVVILQHALDLERAQERAPGTEVVAEVQNRRGSLDT